MACPQGKYEHTYQKGMLKVTECLTLQEILQIGKSKIFSDLVAGRTPQQDDYKGATISADTRTDYEKKEGARLGYEKAKQYAQDKGLKFNYQTGQVADVNDKTAQGSNWGTVSAPAIQQTAGSFSGVKDMNTATKGAGAIGGNWLAGASLVPLTMPAAGAIGSEIVNTARAIGPALNIPIRGIPGLTGSNILWGLGAGYSGNQIIDPNSETRQSINTAVQDPSFGNITNAAGYTLGTGLGFYGLPVRQGLLSLGDDLNKIGTQISNIPSTKVLFQSPLQRLNNPTAYKLLTGNKSGFRSKIAETVADWKYKSILNQENKINSQIYNFIKQGNQDATKPLLQKKNELSRQARNIWQNLDNWRLKYSGLPLEYTGMGGGQGRIYQNLLNEDELVKVGTYGGDETSLQKLIEIGNRDKYLKDFWGGHGIFNNAEIAFPTSYVKFGDKTFGREGIGVAQFMPRLKNYREGLGNYDDADEIVNTLRGLDDMGIGIDYQGVGNIGRVGDKLGLVDLTYVGEPGSRTVTSGIGEYRYKLDLPIRERLTSIFPNFPKYELSRGWSNQGNYIALNPTQSNFYTSVAEEGDNTIRSIGKEVLGDLQSPEGMLRLRNQFKKADPNLTDEQLDYLIANRLNEVSTAIEYNASRFFLDHGKGIPGTKSAPFVTTLIPNNNAFFYTNTPFRLPLVDAPTNLFPRLYNNNANSIGINLAKTSEAQLFTRNKYEPGSIALGIGTSGRRNIGTHEIAHSIQGQGALPLDNELRGIYSQNIDEIKNHISGNAELERDFNYFMNSGDRTIKSEPFPFLAEFRQFMLDRGIIKTRYDKITTEILDKALTQANNSLLPNILEGTRIIKFTPKSLFGKLAEKMNEAPLIQTGITGTGIGLTLGALEQKKQGGQMAMGRKNKTKNLFV
jgi:hypothetical protein